MQVEKNNRLVVIDNLRAVAAFGVFMFHLASAVGFPKFTLPPFTIASKTFSGIPSFFTFGATGVSLFFILSGFCLYLQRNRVSKNGKFTTTDIQNYYINRFARIVPAYVVAVFLSFLIAYFIDSATFKSLLIHLFFLHGFWQNEFLALNGALWSMVTEMQFYLLFPLFWFIQKKLGDKAFLVTSIVATLLIRYLVYNFVPSGEAASINLPSLICYQIPGRISEFAMGMVLCSIYLNHRNLLAKLNFWVIGLILIIALAIRVKGPIWLVDPAIGFSYTLIFGYLIMQKANWFNQNKVLQHLGHISYSFFLIHIPIIGLACYLIKIDDLWLRLFVVLLVSLPFAALLSHFLYRKVELPFFTRYRI